VLSVVAPASAVRAGPTAPFVVVHPSNLDRSDVAPGRDHGGLDFGSLTVGSTRVQTLTITSGGNVPLVIQNVTVAGSDFSVVRGPNTTCVNAGGTVVSIAPGGSCRLQIAFAASPGRPERAAELQIADNAPDSPHYVSLRGTTTAQDVLDGQAGREQASSYPATDPCVAHRVLFGRSVGWGLLSNAPQTLVGQVIEGHMSTEDLTRIPILGPSGLHFAADYNFFVYPDQGFRGLLMPGNFLVTNEYTPSEAGRIEVEWERGGGGRDGIPDWAWPTAGDKVKVVGWHILDCGHGKPNFRTEIHPPLFVATYRNAALAPIGGWNGRLGSFDPANAHEATLVDAFASSYGGGSYGNEVGRSGETHQPVELYTYTFDVMAPPKPSASAALAPPAILMMQGVQTLSWTPTADGRGYHFALRFPAAAQGGASAVFGARIRVAWVDQTAPAITNLRAFQVQPLSLHVIENLASMWPAPRGLYAYVNEQQRGSLLTGGGFNSNNEAYMNVRDGARVDLSRTPPFDVTVVDNQPLHIAFRLSRFNTQAGFWPLVCTSCGAGDPGGTAARFYDPTSLMTPQDITLTGWPDLAGKLGRDEWSSSCPCFEITFRITRK
jgi:hypothetical protein